MEITRQEEDKQGYSSTVKFECKTWIQWGIYRANRTCFKDAE